jgi:hypothetical protein
MIVTYFFNESSRDTREKIGEVSKDRDNGDSRRPIDSCDPYNGNVLADTRD